MVYVFKPCLSRGLGNCPRIDDEVERTLYRYIKRASDTERARTFDREREHWIEREKEGIRERERENIR